MIGKTISHYKIIEKLGEGGMGEVYLAEDLKLERNVAIKFLPQHLTKDKDNVERFEREAKAAASLNHPNIVTIYDVIEKDSQLCIVMEYIEGKSLRDVINEYNLGIDKIIDIVSQLSEGLSEAHKAGIVHRDIKPENIIIDNDARVKILDFGLAKLKGVSKLTKETSTLGTIHYMSPEQLRGDVVDHRSDIWSLGVVFYEMIAGDVPFKGDYDQAVAYSIQSEQFSPLEDINPQHDEVLHKLLAKEPENRYQSLDEFTEVLKEKMGSTEIKGNSKQQKFMIYSLSIIILLIISYFILLYTDFDVSIEPSLEWENSIAVLPFDNISNDPEQEYFCVGMTEQIISDLARSPKLKVISRTSVMKYKNTDKTIPEIGEQLNVAYVLEGSVRKFGDRVRVTAQLIGTKDDFHVWTDTFDREYIDFFKIQDEVSEAIVSILLERSSAEELAEIKKRRPINTKAFEYFLKGKFFHHSSFMNYSLVDKRKENLQKSEMMHKKAIELDPKYADAYAGLADVYNSRYNWFELSDEERKMNLALQENYLDKAFNLDSLSAETYVVKFYLLHIKANKYLAEEEYDKYDHVLYEQFKSLKRAITLNQNHSEAYHTLGYFYYLRGLINFSIKCWSKSIELDPLHPNRYYYRGNQYFYIGEHGNSEADFLKALDLNPNDFATLKQLSHHYITLGRFAETEEIFHRIEKIFPERKINLEFALLYAARGEKEQALKTYTGRNSYLFSLLDMKDEAIKELSDWNSKRLRQKSSRYYFLKFQPLYDNVRFTPRFQEILAKHKELYEENLRKYGDIDL
jgi:serine/threonine protein kinase